jgi:hypothetical protein
MKCRDRELLHPCSPVRSSSPPKKVLLCEGKSYSPGQCYMQQPTQVSTLYTGKRHWKTASRWRKVVKEKEKGKGKKKKKKKKKRREKLSRMFITQRLDWPLNRLQF